MERCGNVYLVRANRRSAEKGEKNTLFCETFISVSLNEDITLDDSTGMLNQVFNLPI